MKVYVLFADLYEGREVLGVYTSLEAAQARIPDVQWESETHYDYERRPPSWRNKDAAADENIEEHELDGAETYEQWLARQPEWVKDRAPVIGELRK